MLLHSFRQGHEYGDDEAALAMTAYLLYFSELSF